MAKEAILTDLMISAGIIVEISVNMAMMVFT